MTRQKQRSEDTRTKLMKAFRDSFLRRGYDKTTTQHVLTATGLSKGALYHHFRSKSDVMEAIYEEESRSTIERALASIDAAVSPLERRRAAYVAWTKEVRSKSASRILFEIGPSALGRQRAKEIENAISLLHIEAILDEAVTAGDIVSADPALIAAMLNALVAEAALYTLRTGKDSSAALDSVLGAAMESMRSE